MSSTDSHAARSLMKRSEFHFALNVAVHIENILVTMVGEGRLLEKRKGVKQRADKVKGKYYEG